MRQAILIGNPGTKRTEYFRQAAAQIGLPVFFSDWRDLNGRQAKLPEGELFIKIDPPLWKSCSLTELNTLAEEYAAQLKELSRLQDFRKAAFLNTPEAILSLLDKRFCKAKLVEAGLPVTECLAFGADKRGGKRPAEQLIERMRETGNHQVFIKPVVGSGAAGVSAFRCLSLTRMALYTCAFESAESGFVNTKRLRRFDRPEEILPLLDRLLELDCIVERWYAKSDYQGFSYDLRAVVRDGAIDFLLARLSKGPITNLHLNNRPLKAEELGLPEETLISIAELCKQAVSCFPGLRSAGIDLLLTKGSKKPVIIEMNAQGDLMYQDIFYENKIYRRQAELMKRWIAEEKTTPETAQ